MGFKLNELKADVIATHLATAKLNPSGDVLMDAGALDAHYKATLPANEEMAQCDCGGVSPCALDACPYCGDGAEIPPTETAPEPAAATPEPEPTPKSTPPPKKTKKKAKAPVKAAEPVDPTPAPKTKAKAAKAPSKAKAPAKSKAPAPKTEVLPAKEAEALATPTVTTLSERTLDTQCRVIQKATKGAATEFIKTAKAFKEVADNDLWKLRVNDRGERAYTNFGQWAKTEFSVSSSYAYQMIRAVTNHSEEQIKAFGMGKIQTVLNLPKDKADAILEGGGTKAEMSDRAKELRDGATPSTPPATPKNPVTVALIEQNIELPLYQRDGDGARATDVAQDPWATMSMENDTQMRFKIQQKDNGELVLHVETRRGDGEAS